MDFLWIERHTVELAFLLMLVAGGGVAGLLAIRHRVSLRDRFLDERLASLTKPVDHQINEAPDIIEPDRETKGLEFIKINKRKACILLIAIGGLLVFPAIWVHFLIWLALVFVGAGILLFLINNRIEGAFSRRISAQFPETLDLFVRGARVGVSAEENIKIVAEEMPMPVSGIFAQMSEQMAIGQSLDQVLGETAEAFPFREFRYLSATLAMQRKTGGQYADILESLSKLLREQQEQEARTHAATSESRLAAKIIAALVATTCLSLFFVNRQQFDFLLEDETGTGILLYCCFSLMIGFLLMQWQISRVR